MGIICVDHRGQDGGMNVTGIGIFFMHENYYVGYGEILDINIFFF